MGRQADRQIGRHSFKQTDRESYAKTDRKPARQAFRHMDRQTGKRYVTCQWTVFTSMGQKEVIVAPFFVFWIVFRSVLSRHVF